MDNQLTQPQREAMIDLLLFAMYEDGRIALQEDTLIGKFVNDLRWESGVARETYVDGATARARTAINTNDGREHFLQKIGARLGTPEAKHRALAHLHDLLMSDHAESPEENTLEQKLRAMWEG